MLETRESIPEHKPQGISMADVQNANARAGLHWFEPDTMRFFRSRVGSTIYEGPGGVFFVSSEQFVGSQGAAPRAYTVRVFVTGTGAVDTADKDFNERSRSSAVQHAQELAAGKAKCFCLRCRNGSHHLTATKGDDF